MWPISRDIGHTQTVKKLNQLFREYVNVKPGVA